MFCPDSCRDAARRRERRPFLSTLQWVASMSVVAFPLGAQESPLRPLSEQLAEAPEGSAETMRYVARRCSALFSLVSDQYEQRRDAGTAEMYMSWSLGFELAAARVDIELGATPEDAVRNNKAGIAQIADGLRERVNRTRSLGDDPLLANDVRTCRVLVDDLGLEGTPGFPPELEHRGA